jgi:DNA replication protein DnaC
MNQDSLQILLKGLHLHGMHLHAQTLAITAEREGLTFLRYLHLLAEVEHQDRLERRTARLRKLSRLPASKTLATLQQERFSSVARRHIATLCAGDFVAKAHNVLAFGLPGRGKTHVLCAIGHCLVDKGHTVLFTPTYQLVQRLLAAKANLRLDKELRRLDHFDAIICDDIGYVQQSRDEMEVLFTFLAERYERKSVLLSSNLVFSQWDRIFKDPMTTAAAIDRLVHHATILELTGASYRTDAAKQHPDAMEAHPPTGHRGGGQGEPANKNSTLSTCDSADVPAPPQRADHPEVHVNF